MTEITVTPDNHHVITSDLANHYKILPKATADSEMVFFIDAENDNAESKEELELLLGKSVRFEAVGAADIEKALSIYHRKERQLEQKAALNIEKNDFLENLLSEAKSLKSSDVHFEVYEANARIRFRIDGQLIERYKVDRENYLELVNKIKIKSKLNITEKRLPQDGRITTDSFDIRVSILPTLFGEKIVLRLLGQDASNIDLSSLGLKEEELATYMEAVRKPNGIILISRSYRLGKNNDALCDTKTA
ncbi:GspE/PulE family protein [Flavobacterium sp. 3HN19-14]|uniref:GspE/PulE family protein n=1 Tax=Flavobacterium sp. 3HN19-14 TaxID=3448133 RepID=UPI003EE0584E